MNQSHVGGGDSLIRSSGIESDRPLFSTRTLLRNILGWTARGREMSVLLYCVRYGALFMEWILSVINTPVAMYMFFGWRGRLRAMMG